MRLLHNLVAIREDVASDVSAGGIQLVKTEKSNQGTIVLVGPGVHTPTGEFIETTVKPEDQVLFSKQTSTCETIEYNGETLLLMPETNIIAVVNS